MNTKPKPCPCCGEKSPRVTHVYPPIPTRRLDWSVACEGCFDADSGEDGYFVTHEISTHDTTRQGAIAKWNALDPEEFCQHDVQELA